jgi:chemotaxis protein MotB
MRLLLLALLTSGCVAKGRYELLEVQLDATRTAVSARGQQHAEETRAMEARIAELEEELVLRKAELDLLRVREALSDHAVAVAQEQVEQLLGEIQRLEAVKAGGELPPDLTHEVPQPEVDAGVLHARTAVLADALAPVLDRVELRIEDTEVVVTVPLAQLVQEGWTTLSPRGEVLVKDLARALSAVPGAPVRVEGHTDTVPRHSATFPSNWERGFGAALVMLRGLEAEGAPVQLSAASLAGTRPLDGIDPQDDAQQRVELWVELDPAAQQRFEGLPDDEG